jgi:putative transposase
MIWCRQWVCRGSASRKFPSSAKPALAKAGEIDERVNAFLDRPLAGEWPYLWLDATYLKQREGGRIVSVAAIIAVAANTDGRREIVGLHIGPSEAETFWSTFLKSMARRGLRGIKLVISDAHEGLKAAIRRVFGAT